ncbi:hypothetical protein PYCC9005_005682 [Savitreella phatthalungensis]
MAYLTDRKGSLVDDAAPVARLREGRRSSWADTHLEIPSDFDPSKRKSSIGVFQFVPLDREDIRSEKLMMASPPTSPEPREAAREYLQRDSSPAPAKSDVGPSLLASFLNSAVEAMTAAGNTLDPYIQHDAHLAAQRRHAKGKGKAGAVLDHTDAQLSRGTDDAGRPRDETQAFGNQGRSNDTLERWQLTADHQRVPPVAIASTAGSSIRPPVDGALAATAGMFAAQQSQRFLMTGSSMQTAEPQIDLEAALSQTLDGVERKVKDFWSWLTNASADTSSNESGQL